MSGGPGRARQWAGSSTYIANGGSGPWKSGSSGAANWSSTGGTYTIFSANYLNWFHYHSTTIIGTRIQIMKDVVKSVVDSNTNINIGLMRYDTKRTYGTPPSGNKGGPVIFPMSNIDAPDVRNNFKSAVDGLTAERLDAAVRDHVRGLSLSGRPRRGVR